MSFTSRETANSKEFKESSEILLNRIVALGAYTVIGFLVGLFFIMLLPGHLNLVSVIFLLGFIGLCVRTVKPQRRFSAACKLYKAELRAEHARLQKEIDDFANRMTRNR